MILITARSVLGVRSDELGGIPFPVGELHIELRRPARHMVVRQDVPLSSTIIPVPSPFFSRLNFFGICGVLKKRLKKGFRGEGEEGIGDLLALGDLNVHHGRGCSVGHLDDGCGEIRGRGRGRMEKKGQAHQEKGREKPDGSLCRMRFITRPPV